MNVEAGQRFELERIESSGDMYHRTWYPVALSESVAPNKVIGADFLNGRIVIWRKENGDVEALSAYCRHLGADLSLAEPVDGKLRCPFHHWSYDDEGKCVDIPCAKATPSSARLFKYPTAEKHGLIWVFNGEKPEFPVADFGDCYGTEFVAEARCMGHVNVPAWVLKLNTLDVQHTKALHKQELIEYPQMIRHPNGVMSFNYVVRDKGIGVFTVTGNYFGPNCFALAGKMENGAVNLVVSGGTPVPQGGHDLFVCLLIPLNCNGVKMSRAEGEEKMADLWEYYLRLYKEDLDIINTMRFRLDHLVADDKYMNEIVDYARSFPAGNPGGAFIA